MFEVGQVVYDPLTKRTLRVESVKTFDAINTVLVRGKRLKKDGNPYNRRVHSLMTHSEKYPLQIIK